MCEKIIITKPKYLIVCNNVYITLTSGISIGNFFPKIVITAVTFFIPEHIFATRVTKCQKGKMICTDSEDSNKLSCLPIGQSNKIAWNHFYFS